MKLERPRFTYHRWLPSTLFAVLAGAFSAYIWSEKQIDQTSEQRLQSLRLTDELRQSSDNRSRMARTYVVTRDTRYKAAYQAILDIQNGARPRPPDYPNGSWDAPLSSVLAETPGPAIALLVLMQQAGFTQPELEQSNLVPGGSDPLQATEALAMQLLERNDAPGSHARARLLLHDDAYHAAKAAHMQSIQEFARGVDRRTQQAVDSAQTRATALRMLSIALALGLMTVLLRVKSLLRRTLGGPVDEVFAHISRIGQGELQTPITVTGANQNSVLGWLAQTQANLKSIDNERRQALAKSAESEAHLRSIIEAEPECIKIVDASGLLLQMNPAGLAMIEADHLSQVAGQAVLGLVAPEYRADFAAMHQRVLAGESVKLTFEVTGLRGARRWLESHAVPLLYQGQTVQLAVSRDITERKLAEEALRIAATAFESQQGMFITNAQQLILRVNQAFTTITGFGAQEAIGRTPSLLASGRHDAAYYNAMAQSLEHQGNWQGEIWNRRKDGEVYPEWLNISAVKNEAGQVTNYVATFSDISERLAAQAQIETLAFYDPLTGLPNRRLLMDRLNQAQNTSAHHARRNALLFVDLDNFKTLNDTLGHLQGDALLVQVAQRLKTCIRDGDSVARLGGDEFVVMLEDLSEHALSAATQGEAVGEKILTTLDQSYPLASGSYHCSASIGITLFGGAAAENSDEPLKRAELAMFQAKSAGRHTLRFFDTQMQAEVSLRAALEADLREAVQQQQLSLHYQPQVVGDGYLTGVEALLRWQHPRRGLVLPTDFIPLAEACGLIAPIGQWVLETACAQLALWAKDPGLARLTMAVNVSARQFNQTDFVDTVLATLARTQAKPKLLKLELTESMLVDDVEDIIDKMNALKAKGVGFSLDDFGTGYSSLAYLKRLPLDQLKIDQGFVKNIVTDPNDAAIAKMVIALAESMGLSVIAEGVELQAQADFLAHLGCHAYQGYLFSRPLPLAAFDTFKSLARIS